VVAASPAYHDHPPQRLLQNFPHTTYFPRFRASALFRRRPPEHVETSSLPASENLHNCGPCLRCATASSRAGAASKPLAPSQMRELAIYAEPLSRLSFDVWIERGQRDREQVVQPKPIWVAYSKPLIDPNWGGRGRQQRRCVGHQMIGHQDDKTTVISQA
jgi:hypothetical protein